MKKIRDWREITEVIKQTAQSSAYRFVHIKQLKFNFMSFTFDLTITLESCL